MRIYLWNDNEYQARLKRGLDHQNTLTFVEDVQRTVKLECGFCHTEFILEELNACPHCAADLIFPRCEW